MDRRCAVRREPLPGESLSRVRLRTGRELQVIDLSNSGALVEGHSRLLPGTHVDVHIVTTDGRVLVRGRVVRAYVSHVDAERICYRGALAFDVHIDAAAGPCEPADPVLPDPVLPDGAGEFPPPGA